MAFETSNVADSFNLGNVPFTGIVPKYDVGRLRLILPDVSPLAVSVAELISTESTST